MIRNILFDLGGVIMDIRRSDCIEAFRKLGMAHPEQFLGEYVQSGPFMGIENGSVTPQQFRDEMRSHLREGVIDDEIDRAFEAFLVGIPSRRLNALKELRSKGYKICLLSNTNPIMWEGKISQEFRKEGESGPEAYFDGMVRSYAAKVMKPDPEIFRLAARECGIKPSETIFIDDSQTNLDAASREGFATLLVAPGEEFPTLLEERFGI